jgi:parallel beta-helix repeat protein
MTNFTKSSAKKLMTTTAMTAAGLLMFSGAAMAGDGPVGDYDVWEFGSFQSGAEGTITDQSQGYVQYSGDRIIGDLVQEDIGRLGHVDLKADLTVATGVESGVMQILGTLTSSGQVFVLDVNGVMFGEGSVVDTAGFAAIGGKLGEGSNLTGDDIRLNVDVADGADISIHEGATISVSEAGLAAFVAPTVSNAGVIQARMGKVVIGSAETATLDLYGDGLVEIALDGEASKAVLNNTGTISAEGGNILVTASAAKDAVDNVINMGGAVNASSATVKGGKIVLGGENTTVNVKGKVDASGTKGGDIEIEAATIDIAQGSEIVNEGDNGNTYIYGTEKAIFRGSMKVGTNATAEVSGTELSLGGTFDLGEGTRLSFDPVTLLVDAAEAASIESAMNNNGVIVDVEAQERIIVESEIDTSAQTTNSTLNFKDEDANNDLIVDLDALIKLGSSQSLTGEATEVNVSTAGSLQNGIDIAATGADVNLSNGIHVNDSQIVIDKNLNIAGAGRADTMLIPLFDTGSSGDSRGWFLVDSGIEFHLSDLTMNGNGRDVFQGIRHKGFGTIDNVAFNDIQFNPSGPNYSGVAVAAFGNGAVDITNSTFTDIGRIGALYFGTGVAGSTFADNTYTGKGVGDWLDYGVEVGGGASDILIERNTITGNRGVASVDGSTSAGVLVTTYYGAGTAAILNDNFITDNTTGVAVGFNNSDGSSVAANGNDLSGNDTGVAFRGTGMADFSGNWWGETDDAAVEAYLYKDAGATGTLDFTPFLMTGTDTDGTTNGFQGDFSHLKVTALGDQTGTTGRIQEGVESIEDGSLIDGARLIEVDDGTFEDGTIINKAVTLLGSGPTNTTTIEVGASSAGMTVTSSDVTIDGFRFERDGNASNATGIILDGRSTVNGTISNILIGDTALDADIIGNYFVDGLNIGVLARGDVDNAEISDNTFGEGTGNDRISKGIVSRVERSGSNVVDGAGNVLGQTDIAPHNDWFITDNAFSIKNGAKGAAIDLEGTAGTSADAFEISGNTINGSSKAGIHISPVGGNGSGAPYPLTANLLIDDNAITGFGTAIRAGGNFDSISPGNDRFRMSGVNITNNTINDTGTGIDVTGVTFATMDQVVIDGNTINDASNTGIRLNIGGRLNAGDPNWTGFVISDNDVNLGATGTGLAVNYSLDSALEIGTGNSFDGGVDGIVINGQSGRTLTLVGNTLNDTEFTNQSGDYIRLEDTALFDPGQPTVIDATAVTFEGKTGADGTSAENLVVESKIVHRMDAPDLGLINFADGELYVTTGSLGIQNAVDLSSANGKVVVDDGTYVENVLIDVEGLKLEGNGTTIQYDIDEDGPGRGDDGNVITVTASNVDIDPITFDGLGIADYGINAAGLAALGLIIDGNTFKNFNQAGIYLEANLGIAGTTSIINNIFEGSATRGLRTGNLRGPGYILNISDNIIGSLGDEVNTGLDIGRVINSTVNVDRGTINANGDAIYFRDGTFNTSTVTLTDVVATGNDEALDIQGIVRTGGTFNVNGGTLNGGANGVEFQKVDGSLAFTNATIDGASNDGANMLGEITGSVAFNGGSVTGNQNGIGSANGANSINGGTFEVTNATITGTTENGIELGAVSNSSTVNISNNVKVDGNENAIHFASGIDSSDVDINGNTLIEGSTGIRIGSDGTNSISGNADVNIDNNVQVTASAFLAAAILVEDNVTGTSQLSIAGNDIDSANGGGIAFLGDVNNARGGSQQDIFISNNDIDAGLMGVGFNGTISNNSNDVRIVDNDINVTSGNGIRTATINDASVWILSNDNIIASSDAIRIGSMVNGARVRIHDNVNIESTAADGVDVVGEINDSHISILRNDIIADDNGVEFDSINDGKVEIIGNNNGIEAGDHGIAFGAITNTSDIDIHDNIIQANLDRDAEGAGIWFNGDIINSDVNVGDGDRTSGNRSNIISVRDNAGGSDADNDGIRFNGTIGNNTDIKIDGNRIGYYAQTLGGTLYTVFGYNRRIADDGIEFAGAINSSADVEIEQNFIRADNDGIKFGGEISGNADVTIGGSNANENTINANDKGIVFTNNITGNSQVEISYNDIDADNDGVLFSGNINNFRGGSQSDILIDSNEIDGGADGVVFEGTISDNRNDVLITGNDIDGAGDDGVAFEGTINDASIWIVGNDSIVGDNDGIQFARLENDARVRVHNNTKIEGEDDDGIDFTTTIQSSHVSIFSNDEILADDGASNGIEFSNIWDAKVEITTDAAGQFISADGHGIYVGGSVASGSDIDIHDNNIFADENNNGAGDGILFDGDIYTATINIGDGDGSSLTGNPSNIIRGENGIKFDNLITNGAQIKIDGNRIGYRESAGSLIADSVGDDGIEFDGSILGNADIEIIDNHIESDDDGIYFDNGISGNANILIGGLPGNKNTINAGDEGIEFDAAIHGNSYIEISHNAVDADGNGVEFNGATSNVSANANDIYLHNNDIVGGWNGVIFTGIASGADHNIKISENDIEGEGIDGVSHIGWINAAMLDITDNTEIKGNIDGVYVSGALFNNAIVNINDNLDITATLGDGVEVWDIGLPGNSDVNILRNAIHDTGDNGIEVFNVDNVEIIRNRINDAGDDGIDVKFGSNADIQRNIIRDSVEDGIDVEDNAGAQIVRNNIRRSGADGIEVERSNGVYIFRNRVRASGDDGIDVENSNNSEITRNRVRNSTANGIEVEDSDTVTIDRNNVRGSDLAGIFVDPSSNIIVSANTATGNNIGIQFDDVTIGTISGNTVENNITVGIQVEDSDGIEILGNEVLGNGDVGLYAIGGGNGNLEVSDNIFTDNPIHAQFESGIIDLTGLGNTFTDGVTAMRFAPFDLGGGAFANMELVGNTIGEQTFDGQSQFYVELDNGAFFDPGTPTILNALDSTYIGTPFGTVTPSVDFPSGFTLAQLGYFEGRFYHFNDDGTLGLFFFPPLPSISQEDIFQFFANGGGDLGGLNVTILGMPSVPGGPQAASFFNNLSPAAGGNTAEALNNLSPAAGGDGGGLTPEELNALETAAGDEDTNAASCWSDAMNAAGVGGAVNFSYGSGVEALLESEASCGS